MSFSRHFRRQQKQQKQSNVVTPRLLKSYQKPPTELQKLLELPPTRETLEEFEQKFISAAGLLLAVILASHGRARGAFILDLTRWPKTRKDTPFLTAGELEQKLALYDAEKELIKSYNRLTTGLVFVLRPGGKRKLWEVEFVK